MIPNKIDKDKVHTALAIAGCSALMVGIINIGLEELKFFLVARRKKTETSTPPVVNSTTTEG